MDSLGEITKILQLQNISFDVEKKIILVYLVDELLKERLIMNFMFRRTFWGILIVLIGVLYIINNIFGTNIPVWNIFWPFVIIMVGISLLYGHRGIKTESQIIFDEGDLEISSENRDYSTVFGSSTYDFRKIKLNKKTINIEASTVFGATKILIDEKIPMRIKASSAFGGVKLPDGSTVAFSEREYFTKSYKKILRM